MVRIEENPWEYIGAHWSWLILHLQHPHKFYTRPIVDFEFLCQLPEANRLSDNRLGRHYRHWCQFLLQNLAREAESTTANCFNGPMNQMRWDLFARVSRGFAHKWGETVNKSSQAIGCHHPVMQKWNKCPRVEKAVTSTMQRSLISWPTYSLAAAPPALLHVM